MVFSLKKDGVWRNAVTAYVNVNGTWKVIDEAKRNDNGTWKLFHQNIIEETATNTVNLNAQNLFSASDWSNSVPKRVIIPAGVTIGSSNSSLPAFRTGTGRGGTLEVIIEGEVQGASGAANSGSGGIAALIEQSTSVILSGAVRGGGGGGGKGGSGGTGYYVATNTEGPHYSRFSPNWHVKYAHPSAAGGDFWWNGAFIGNNGSNSIASGGWTYNRGASAETVYNGSSFDYYFQISRSNNYNVYTSGGTGGNGGRGQGYLAGKHNGSGGAAGGTNAGTGGTGGNGGTWGTGGSTGATGGSGNAAGGTGGSAGGAAGAAFSGNSLLTLTNNGTVNGPIV